MPNGIWIGLQYQALTQENKWMDGSVLQYSNFYPLLYGRLRKVEFDVSSQNFLSVVDYLL